ncbi:hypothetical protein GCM10007079_04200 [Nocardiopsis terrae]|nr:hypothetical protein GCM10007079_04200 [Nocardiopsis terrae]
MPEEIDESFQDSSQEVLDPCKDPTPKEDCSFVSTSIGEFRYRIIRGTGDVAAVVDVGGPGSSILSGDVNLNDLTSSLSLPEDYSVIFIEEPWVRKPTSDECKSGLSNFYMNSRDPGGPNKEEADNLVEACEIRAGGGNWGFSSNTYSEVVAAIEESESVSVNGFLGYSFGSARLSYLENWEFDWVSLIRPFPVGASGTKLMESRSNQVGNIYEKIKHNSEEEIISKDAPSRSIEVDEFDYLSAEIAVGYLDSEDISSYSGQLNSRSNDYLAGQLSDSFWMRYGEMSISPGYLAYLSEVCAVSDGWEPTSYSEHSHMSILEGMHLPCSSIDSEEGGKSILSISAENFCIVVADADPLTEPWLVRDSFGSIENGTWINSEEVSHSSSDGTTECLDAVVS